MDVGWTLGGGFEYVLWQNFSLEAEYLYVSLQGRSLTESALVVPVGTLLIRHRAAPISTSRAGINYRFYWPARTEQRREHMAPIC